MGWNTSLIIIENIENYSNETELLKTLGFDSFEQKENTTFDAILNAKDNKIGIGYYNRNLIISDGYLLTSESLDESNNLNLAGYEKRLVALFPMSEIVTVSCVSTVNFHGYSLIQNGQKERLKYVSEELKQEFGDRFEEENAIYKDAYEANGQLFWKDENDQDEAFSEDQLMEDFTFKVAKRRLGVQIDLEEGEDLLENTPFKVFQITNLPKKQPKTTEPSTSKPFKWKKYLVIAAILIIIRILLKTISK